MPGAVRGNLETSGVAPACFRTRLTNAFRKKRDDQEPMDFRGVVRPPFDSSSNVGVLAPSQANCRKSSARWMADKVKSVATTMTGQSVKKIQALAGLSSRP
jgi:hypothetical protein